VSSDPSNPSRLSNPFLGITARSLAIVMLVSIVLAFVECGIATAILAVTTDISVEAISAELGVVLLPLFWYVTLWLGLAGLGRRRGLDVGQVVGAFPPQHPWFQLIAIVIGILGFSLGAFVLSASGLALAAPEVVESIVQDLNREPMLPSQGDVGVRLLTIVTLVIAAPIVEELFFRGLLLQRWAVKWGIRPAILASSLLFGCLHANPVGLTMFGVMMAVIYIRSRQLWVTILAHSLNNAIAVLLSVGGEAGGGGTTALTLKSLQNDWWVGLLLVGLTLPGLVAYLYRNWPISGAVTPYFINVNDRESGK
jgi:uncharacterized protein